MSTTSNAKRARMQGSGGAATGSEDASRKERILAAAIEQFSEKGYAALRIDEVAAAADANKQLIYYYFGSKADLYNAALARLVELTVPVWAELESTATLEQAIERYSRRSDLGITWRRFMAWEGVEQAARGVETIHLEDIRTEAWRHLVRVVEKAQARGELAADLDPGMFALLITGFTSTPFVLPQIAKMIAGTEPDSEEFMSRQRALIGALLAALRPDATT